MRGLFFQKTGIFLIHLKLRCVIILLFIYFDQYIQCTFSRILHRIILLILFRLLPDIQVKCLYLHTFLSCQLNLMKCKIIASCCYDDLFLLTSTIVPGSSLLCASSTSASQTFIVFPSKDV